MVFPLVISSDRGWINLLTDGWFSEVPSHNIEEIVPCRRRMHGQTDCSWYPQPSDHDQADHAKPFCRWQSRNVADELANLNLTRVISSP
jgi:hypothetical protein